MNIILNTDFYKASHFLQYPPGTMFVESYIESRGGEYDYTLFCGLQAFIKDVLLKPITLFDIIDAREVFTTAGLPFNEEGWLRIVNHHKGKIPVEIKAVKEGSKVPVKNALVVVRNTDGHLPWLTSYIETALLRAVWYPSTVATISHEIHKVIKAALIKSGGLDGIDYKLNDFGSRGVSSCESSGIGGFAHLINFKGTDNVPGIMFARQFYKMEKEFSSIPAAEHSTITSWGKSKELQAYDNMLKQFAKPGALVAVVSDSYDLWNACSNLWGSALKDDIIKSGATVIIRPDSGHPSTVVLKTLRLLDEKFGHTINTEGYKVLNNVKVIQGDGINLESIKEILAVAMADKYSAENIAFGMGGALLQHMNRDTQKWAMKASSVAIFDEKTSKLEEREVFKQPATDFGKSSKKGRQMLYIKDNDFNLDRRYFLLTHGGQYMTAVLGSQNRDMHEALETVYLDGKLIRDQTLTEIRELAKN